ncbi:hypothetical protein CFP56_035414 [Quercus suber]|uniref:Uncharacterized protein n=1 Tax=Quercus suber TaxID=58331 RepID=A0AAW0J9F4_QUESU
MEEIHLLAHITFYFQVQSSPKSWQCFGHMDEVICGGNAMKFYAIEDKVNLLSLLIIRGINKLARASTFLGEFVHMGFQVHGVTGVSSAWCHFVIDGVNV